MNALSETKPAPAQVTPPTPPRRSLKRHLRLPLLLLVAAGATLGGAWQWSVGRFLESTDNAYVQGDIAVLSARVDGHVAAIRVTDNQAVRAGEPLIELDGAVWRAALAQAEASLAGARAALGTLREQIEAQEAQVAVAEAQGAQARAEQERAAADAKRYDTLSGQGYSSRQAYEHALADQRKAAASVAAATAQAVAARKQRAVLEAQLVEAEARQAQAEAALARARVDLENTVIRAPFDGIVGNARRSSASMSSRGSS